MSTPPLYGPLEIRGFTFEKVLGSGGFADVFRYAQHMPKRRVAVKIMRAMVSSSIAREQFESEANLMAQLSSHPSIVTIYFAAVAENGRPFLVMEYCSGPNLADRTKQKAFSVPEMLQVMVRLCGAVETAHRAGILHRDIKPANVLTTDYGWPALTDFGISVIAGEATIGEGGLSIPWAPPEAIGGAGKVDVRSDVYSLAATAYTLLAGRSPFDEVTANPHLSDLMQRIHSAPVPPIGRSDVPYQLEQLLALAMSKDPDDRPQSASALARGLQRIEQDMSLPVTHMDVPGGLLGEIEGAAPGEDDAVVDFDHTRIASSHGSAQAADVDEATRLRGATQPEAPAAAAAAGPEPESTDSEPEWLEERTRFSDRTVAPIEPADEATRIRQAPDADPELDDKTRVSQREVPDEKTRLSSRREPKPETPPEDRTQVTKGPRARAAVQTTAADLPRRAERVAYIPGLDKDAKTPEYAIRSAPMIDQVPRRPVTPSTAAEHGPIDVVGAQRARAKSKGRSGLIVIIIVVAAAIILIGGGITALVLIANS